jgi:hypothetical protein
VFSLDAGTPAASLSFMCPLAAVMAAVAVVTLYVSRRESAAELAAAATSGANLRPIWVFDRLTAAQFAHALLAGAFNAVMLLCPAAALPLVLPDADPAAPAILAWARAMVRGCRVACVSPL